MQTNRTSDADDIRTEHSPQEILGFLKSMVILYKNDTKKASLYSDAATYVASLLSSTDSSEKIPKNFPKPIDK